MSHAAYLAAIGSLADAARAWSGARRDLKDRMDESAACAGRPTCGACEAIASAHDRLGSAESRLALAVDHLSSVCDEIVGEA